MCSILSMYCMLGGGGGSSSKTLMGAGFFKAIHSARQTRERKPRPGLPHAFLCGLRKPAYAPRGRIKTEVVKQTEQVIS